MRTPTKLFTLSEANALIPNIRERYLIILEKKESHARRHDELFLHELLTEAESELGKNPSLDNLELEIHGFEASMAEFVQDIKAILDLGCTFRTNELCCIDFPAKNGSEIIYYCWKPEEAKIAFYHPAQNGSEERLPLRV